eukprot:13039909-Ditylum_brightwellii.AAC.1
MSEHKQRKQKRSAVAYTKGDPIRFFNGNRIPVIVAMGADVEKATCVSVWSCAKCHPEKAGSFVEAVFMQKPEIEKQ